MEPFGVGGRRLCYVHPLDPGKCVKVLRQDARRTVRSSRNLIPNRFRRRYDNNANEFAVLTRLFERIGPAAAQCLPRCYGWTETDLGPGLVLDLIRDRDGGISRNLRELVSTGAAVDTFRPAFDELAAFLIEHTVLTRALLDHNIAAQDRGGGCWRLFIIDGLGDPAWLPLAQSVRPLARARINRRIAEFWPRLERLALKPVTAEDIRRSSWGQGFLKHRG